MQYKNSHFQRFLFGEFATPYLSIFLYLPFPFRSRSSSFSIPILSYPIYIYIYIYIILIRIQIRRIPQNQNREKEKKEKNNDAKRLNNMWQQHWRSRKHRQWLAEHSVEGQARLFASRVAAGAVSVDRSNPEVRPLSRRIRA